MPRTLACVQATTEIMHPGSLSICERRTLITGVTGFVGCYLADALVARGERVVGLTRHPDWPVFWKALESSVSVHECDLCEGNFVEQLIREIQPTHIYHLAGYANVGQSFKDPEAAWSGNLTATRRLCEAVIRWGGAPRILFVGSGLVYGPPEHSDQLFNEACPLRPDTPYAASKAAADLACYQYTCSPGLDIIRARPFNHIGPQQSPEFAIPNFARQIAAIERGDGPPVLETGNLAAQRDLSDVRDVVMAYLLLMEKGRSGEAYNIGSGQSFSMQAVLERMLKLTGLRVEVHQRADLLRPTEPATIRVDISKVSHETGWQPRYSLDQTLADTIEEWRNRM